MERNSAFVDTSVLIAAALSSRGGSFYILTRLHDEYAFLINQYVLTETLRVLTEKFADREEIRHTLFLLLGIAHIGILADPLRGRIHEVREIINRDDAPILVSALEHAAYLITLDQDFLDPKVKKFSEREGLSIETPRDFLLRHRQRP